MARDPLTSVAALVAASREPNVRAMLDAISACEGTEGPNGYRMHFGKSLFDSFGGHPRKVITATMKGQVLRSSAAGRYQIMQRTWDDLQQRWAFPDFSPQSQDAAAVALILRRGALEAVRAGEVAKACDLLKLEWASLPGSTYGQPTKALAFVRAKFLLAGGSLAAPNAA